VAVESLSRHGLAADAVRWVALIFGAFLVLTGLKMLLAPEKDLDPQPDHQAVPLRRAGSSR
jgi:hypothetical protein